MVSVIDMISEEHHLTARILQTVTLVAAKHSCLLVGIDWDKKIISLEGLEKDESACAMELEELLGNELS